MLVDKCSRSAAYRKEEKKRLRNLTLREELEAERMEFSSIVKPHDNLNIYPVVYPRIDDADGYGYIPGELYCNCLFYFTKPGDLVIDLMAGSGMIQHVYNDRALWMRPKPWDLDLRMYDLIPRGRYKDQITAHDMLRGFPSVEGAPDYVIIDPPYFGCVRNQYSDRPDDIANKDVDGWAGAMRTLAQGCASVRAKLCTVIVANYANPETGEVVLCAEIVRDAWKAAGYELLRPMYASKRIQAARADARGAGKDRMAVKNNRAKRTRIPLNDIAEVLTFRRL
jgi:ParB family chromosome partitioning protein